MTGDADTGAVTGETAETEDEALMEESSDEALVESFDSAESGTDGGASETINDLANVTMTVVIVVFAD